MQRSVPVAAVCGRFQIYTISLEIIVANPQALEVSCLSAACTDADARRLEDTDERGMFGVRWSRCEEPLCGVWCNARVF